MTGLGDASGDANADWSLGEPFGGSLAIFTTSNWLPGLPTDAPPNPPNSSAPTLFYAFALADLADGNRCVAPASFAEPSYELSDAPVLSGEVAQEQLFFGAAPIGDVNGDAQVDWLFRGFSRSYLLFGPVATNAMGSIREHANLIFDHSALGIPIQTLGDINGDSKTDLVFLPLRRNGAIFIRNDADTAVLTLYGARIQGQRYD